MEALYSLTDRKIDLMLISNGGPLHNRLDNLERLKFQLPQRDEGILKKMKRVFYRDALQRDELDTILSSQSIEVFSHGYGLGKRARTPVLHWIPDLQEKYFPQFFSSYELNRLTNYRKKIAYTEQLILFSSKSAENDFNLFFPKNNAKKFILSFSGQFRNIKEENFDLKCLNDLDINQDFFYLPNQFWKHKNHIVVLEALNILKMSGECPKVICTGSTEDYRNPDFFNQIKNKIVSYGLQEDFIILGLVDLNLVHILMTKSMAIINPSLFEGWSSTVEEAKSLGKKIILSNIPVHLEQKPERGHYFSPHNAEELSSLIKEVNDSYSQEEESKAMKSVEEKAKKRFQIFGEQYQEIILDVIKNA
jgi:glycosyltransferase involved in cell wall biosynthesis